MTSDFEPDDEFVHHVLDDLVPKIDSSVCSISIMPTRGTDVKFAVELGVSIMLDKPIILVVQPGAEIPHHLARVADEIIEMGPHAKDALHTALQRIVKQAAERPDTPT